MYAAAYSVGFYSTDMSVYRALERDLVPSVGRRPPFQQGLLNSVRVTDQISDSFFLPLRDIFLLHLGTQAIQVNQLRLWLIYF